MAILTHGSDLSLAPSLGALVRDLQIDIRKALAMIAEASFESVVLDVSLKGIRPRELDQRARKDLLAAIARAGLRLGGVELFVPRKHLLASDTVDRAVSALLEAIELTGDLARQAGRLSLVTALPLGKLDEQTVKFLIEAAEGRGIALAVHGESDLESAVAWAESLSLPSVGLAIDPATLLLQGQDPCEVLQQQSKYLLSARLSDADVGQGQRTPVGQGDLDVMAYRISADLAKQRVGPMVLDLRGAGPGGAAMQQAAKAWDDAAIEL